MEPRYHAQITRQALQDRFSDAAMKKIIAANLYQDGPAGQIGHAEYHFDSNAFEKSYAYIEEQRGLVVTSLQSKDVAAAWAAFGRLTHSAQDFYAHSNYVDLWLSRQNGAVPTPAEIDPVDPMLIDHPALHSGKVYMLLELFTLIKPIKRFVKPLLPRDSHAWMNLDSPETGSRFEYAFHAAVKRTKMEFEKTTADMPEHLRAIFTER